MTNLRKAAEDLLEVVEAAIKAGDWKVDGACDLDLAIVRLRQALAQPEQEPVAWMNNDYEVFFDAGKAACYSMGWIKPLYTAPPKREWVGLTDEEMKKTWYETKNIMGWYSFEEIARLVEAKLKEKNT